MKNVQRKNIIFLLTGGINLCYFIGERFMKRFMSK